MIKTHHILQQWDQWLSYSLGDAVLRVERKFLNSVWERYENCSSASNKQIILIGVPHQTYLLPSRTMIPPILVSSLSCQEHFIQSIESYFHELPILSGSVDCVILPHTLDFVDNPQQLLAEVCRIVKPEGEIIVLGFNPYSLWGLKRYLAERRRRVQLACAKNKQIKHTHIPWTGTFHKASTILRWLKFAEFEIIKQKRLLFRPPIQQERFFQKLSWLESIGSQCYSPFGGVYAFIAKAKVIPLTPIRLHWRQQLPALSPHFSSSA